MMHIKFKYQYDHYNKENVLTANIYYGSHELFLWDTTSEEAYTRAMQLAGIDVCVDWNWDDDDDDDGDDDENGYDGKPLID